jgi:hypothetical protein
MISRGSCVGSAPLDDVASDGEDEDAEMDSEPVSEILGMLILDAFWIELIDNLQRKSRLQSRPLENHASVRGQPQNTHNHTRQTLNRRNAQPNTRRLIALQRRMNRLTAGCASRI